MVTWGAVDRCKAAITWFPELPRGGRQKSVTQVLREERGTHGGPTWSLLWVASEPGSSPWGKAGLPANFLSPIHEHVNMCRTSQVTCPSSSMAC